MIDRGCLALACLAFVACAAPSGTRHPDADAWASMEHPPGTRLLGAGSNASSTYWRIEHLDDAFIRSVGLGHRGDPIDAWHHLHVKDREVDPETGRTYTEERWTESPIRFHLELASRGSHELWVLGERTDGIDVIERWDIHRQPGAYVAERWSAGPVIGVPLPLVRPPVTSIVGGVFLEPDMRGDELLFDRTTMYEAEPGHAIVSFDVDMDGRYLVVIDDDYGIRQILTNGAGSSRRIPGSSTLPTGPMRIDEVSISCDLEFGRILRVGAGAQNFIGMYVDADNDGVFESLEVHDIESYNAISFHGVMRGEY